jgi:hypothetical protein
MKQRFSSRQHLRRRPSLNQACIILFTTKAGNKSTSNSACERQPVYLEHDRWDEWVSPSRLLKYNEANITLQKALQAQRLNPQGASTSSATKHGKAQASSSGAGGTRGVRKDGARGTKRGREEVSLLILSLPFSLVQTRPP